PLIEARARPLQLNIRQKLAAGPLRMMGNLTQVQQVLINLANNAMDAMGPNGTLTIETDVLAEDNREWVCLRVIDTGTGIPADVLPRIFEPFFSTKMVGSGTGLGLAISHEIVQRHSGSIDVESQPGRTEFCV